MLDFMKLFADMEQLFEPFSDEERGRLLTAMMAYCFRGEEPNFSGNERFIWPVLRRHFDLCEEKQKTQEENGRKGGRPPKNPNPAKAEETQTNPNKPNETQQNPTKPNKTLQEQEQEQEHIQEQEHKERTVRATRFTPPTVEEVKGYCQERKNTVDPQRFVDFYSAKGWRVGNQPMRDWRAAVRTWEGREKGQPIKADFQRRKYTADEYAGMYTDVTAEIAAQKAGGA